MVSSVDEGMFLSLTALKAAHAVLIQRRRQEEDSDDLLDAIEHFLERAQQTGVLLDDEDDRAAAQSLLTYWANLLYRSGREPPDASLADFDPQRAPILPDELCPYVGLDAFREHDAQRFFGRESAVAALVEHLQHQRLLIIIGPSGSGKSSLVRAGLIPALRDGALPDSEHWRYFPPIVPGSDPIAGLTQLFRPESQHSDLPEKTLAFDPHAENPSDKPDELPEVWSKPNHLTQLIDDSGTTPALVVVDQFEELFTLVEQDVIRQAFIANLLALVDSPEPRHIVVLTIRSDFESFLARIPSLQRRLAKARFQITPLTASEVREAIEAPADAIGLRFEPGVVELLLQDILGEPAGLPLLQFTLLKLWEQRERNRVTIADYERVGGGRQALARSADTFYNELFPEEQITARRILLQMIRPNEGLEITSNRVLHRQLYQHNQNPERVNRVLKKLVAARLVRVTPGETQEDEQIEVAHEALVRNWPTLVRWLEDERTAIATRRRLEARATEWVRLGSGTAGLLDAVQLREAEHWLAGQEAKDLGYDPNLLALVDRSRTEIDREEQEKEAARQRELAQARALAEEQSRRADTERQRREDQQRAIRRQQILSLALAVMSLLAIILLVIALETSRLRAEASDREAQTQRTAAAAAEFAQATEQSLSATEQALRLAAQANAATAQAAEVTAVAASKEADRQAILARADQLAAQSQQQMSEQHPQLSLLLAIESYQQTTQLGLERTAILTQTLNRAISGVGSNGLWAPDGSVTTLAFGAGSPALLVGYQEPQVRLWSLGTNPTAITLPGVESPITTVAASPAGDRRWLVAGGTDGTVYLWDATNPTAAPQLLRGHSAAVTTLSISSDGSRLASGSEDATIRVYNLQSADPGSSVRILSRGNTSAIRAIALSPGGRWLLSGGDGGAVLLWPLTGSNAEAQRVTGRSSRSEPVRAVAFSPDGQRLATGGDDQRIDVWAFRESSGFASNSPTPLFNNAGPIRALVFSGDSHWLVSSTNDGTARLWNMNSLQSDQTVLPGQNAEITTLATGGQWLITGSRDGTARLWDLSAADPAATGRTMGGHDAAVVTVAIDSTQGWLATGDSNGMVRLWPIDPPEALPEEPDALLTLACQTASRNLSQQEWHTYFGNAAYRETCAGFPLP